jgi:hypothetical protein
MIKLRKKEVSSSDDISFFESFAVYLF